jgi:cellulose synthase/poly-beta-1,6-N-acetylglucosamine synthase-like glycosyltransferase
MLRYIEGWNALSEWQLPRDFIPQTAITVLLPARDEAENIAACLRSVFANTYPSNLFEVIVLDDYSTDATVEIVQQFQLQYPNLRIIHLADSVETTETQSFKKKAIELGIAQATGTLIVGTDADCIVQRDWLALFASMYERTGAKFIAAPVNFYQEKKLLEKFQSLDFLGMMTLTGAGVRRRFMRMCNGANVAYDKATFYAVGGFQDIDHVASGDDMLLMQKFAFHFPEKIAFLKNQTATTFTKAKPTWRSFLQQRIRWGSKSSSYTEWHVTFILAMVYFFCCTIVLNTIWLAFSLTFAWSNDSGKLLALQLFCKTVVDFFFLRQSALYFQRCDLMRVFFRSQVLHILYIAIVGTLSNVVKRYEWKGRRVR